MDRLAEGEKESKSEAEEKGEEEEIEEEKFGPRLCPEAEAADGEETIDRPAAASEDSCRGFELPWAKAEATAAAFNCEKSAGLAAANAGEKPPAAEESSAELESVDERPVFRAALSFSNAVAEDPREFPP